MRAARARARAVRSLALWLVRGGGRGGVPAVRSLARSFAGTRHRGWTLARSLAPSLLPSRGLWASSFPLRPGLSAAAPSLPAAPPRARARGLGASVPRLCPPRAGGALANSAPSRALRGGPWPRCSRSRDRSPLSPRSATLPSFPVAQPSRSPLLQARAQKARGARALRTPQGCKSAAPRFSPPRPTFCLLWPRGPWRGPVLPSQEELCL